MRKKDHFLIRSAGGRGPLSEWAVIQDQQRLALDVSRSAWHGRRTHGGIGAAQQSNRPRRRVRVNGVEVRMLRRDFAEWEAAIPARFKELRIRSEDAVGNIAWDWARTT